MAPRVMPLDVLKLRRVLERIVRPVQMAHPPVQSRVPGANIANVALEMLDVDGVEPDERHVQPDICLGELLAKVVWPAGLGRDVLLCAVEGFKEGVDVALVGVGCGGEAGLVDAVVDEVVGPGVGLVDLAAERFGVELDGAVLVIEEAVKLIRVV